MGNKTERRIIKKTERELEELITRKNDRKAENPTQHMWRRDESYNKWGFNNGLQQIIPPTFSIFYFHFSNKYTTTNMISMYIYKVEH